MKEKRRIFVIIAALAASIGFWVIGLSGTVEQYRVEMPELGAVKYVTYQKENGETLVEEKESIGNLYGHLQEMPQKTISASVNDQPVDAFGLIRVEFKKKDNTATMFYFYQRKGKYYMEQPYNGIYSINRRDYEIIDGYAA